MLRVLAFPLGSHLPVTQHRAPTSSVSRSRPTPRGTIPGLWGSRDGGKPCEGAAALCAAGSQLPDQLRAAAGLCKCSSVNQHPAEPGPRQRVLQHSPAPCIATVLPSGRALRDLQPQRLTPRPLTAPSAACQSVPAPQRPAASCSFHCRLPFPHSCLSPWAHSKAQLRREPSGAHKPSARSPCSSCGTPSCTAPHRPGSHCWR